MTSLNGFWSKNNQRKNAQWKYELNEIFVLESVFVPPFSIKQPDSGIIFSDRLLQSIIFSILNSGTHVNSFLLKHRSALKLKYLFVSAICRYLNVVLYFLPLSGISFSLISILFSVLINCNIITVCRGIGEYVNARNGMPANLHPTSSLFGKH